ncbi:hypothetical protein P167DRAFT_303362 [Morchella conica CCBAS932]|uniref:Uncharacterized protein n=1 Tax=Morchella conica CCBAS932 TaxID=1392247 RepID=A0A3N4KFX0_9PEZI|nr:hypothetical protein P167DRAFT_303362 [Morchella conica CCBAS932]
MDSHRLLRLAGFTACLWKKAFQQSEVLKVVILCSKKQPPSINPLEALCIRNLQILVMLINQQLSSDRQQN